MRAYILLLLFFVSALPVLSQPAAFWLEGTVHGIVYDPGRGLLRKVKPTVFEGTLEDAQITVLLDGELVEEIVTNEKGNFSIPLDFNKLYTLIVTKEGYNQSTILVDTRALPKKVQDGSYHFLGAEFVLNSYSQGKDPSLNRELGRLHFNPARELFNLASTESFTPAPGTTDVPTELIQRAIERNNERINDYEATRVTLRKKPRSTQLPTSPAAPSVVTTTPDTAVTVRRKGLNISSRLNLGPQLSAEVSDASILSSKEEAILRAREQLALDKLLQQTRFDSLEILKREAQIQAAEQEIQNARLLIQTQQDKLEAQRNSLILLVLLLLLLVGFLLVVYAYFKSKQRNSQLLEQKNKQITDSINYAQRIQQTILVGERTLKSYLSDSFVLSEPRDIVSGDFYFFHPHPRGYVVAVADCTGHGVPGAFMSLIGHRLLREIIAERGVTDPAQILDQLDVAVHQALQGEKEGDILQDGMDISVCLIEPNSHTLTFAAAMNPAYLIKGATLEVIQADIKSIGGKILRKDRRRPFTNKAISYAPGSMLYLFSDGYMDQFGQEVDQKFNTRRFKDMLLEIQTLPAEEQKIKAAETLLSWRGAVRQTDDVLVLGVRLP